MEEQSPGRRRRRGGAPVPGGRGHAVVAGGGPPGAPRPLTSIALRQVGRTPPPDGGAAPDAAADPLLRSCARRLLAGRTVPRPGGPTANVGLTVAVPLAGGRTVEVRLAVEGMRCRDDDAGAGSGGRLCVILPSTRVTFLDAEETVGGHGGPSEGERAAIPSLPDRPTRPHEHLLHSLRSVLYFGNGRGPRPPVARSFLLSGPPGVGKTHGVGLAVSLANSWPRPKARSDPSTGPGVELVSLRGSEVVAAAASGGSHTAAALELEGHFRRAAARLSDGDAAGRAALVFLDECDALASSPAVSAMLALCLDRMEGVAPVDDGTEGGWERLVVVGATNRADALPAGLRRPGRLDREVAVGPPDVEGRLELLRSLLGRSYRRDDDGDDDCSDGGLRSVAEACVGYVAADLSALVRRAALNGTERRSRLRKTEEGERSSADAPTTSHITAGHLLDATKEVGASCLRDAALSAPPPTSWDDVAGDAGGAKPALVAAVEWPRTRRRAFGALGLRPPRGVLLHGPPGCAKTTLARAAAGSAGASFLSLSPADVYASSYVGEAEGVVRRAFGLARSAAPCVLFFDEVDAVVGSGGGGIGGGHGMERDRSAESRVLSTFLNEMDGVDGSAEDGVLVLAATNRPGTLDAALLRPGRFDRVIYVPPPDGPGRRAILKMEAEKWREALLADSARAAAVDGEALAAEDPGLEGYFDLDRLASDEVSGSMTGAEVVGACRESAVAVMRDLVKHGNNALSPEGGGLTRETAEGLLRSLAKELEASLTRTRPLLSDEGVLLEYTRFEDDHG